MIRRAAALLRAGRRPLVGGLAALLFVVAPAGVVLASHRAADVLGRNLGRDAALALAALPSLRRTPAPLEPAPPLEPPPSLEFQEESLETRAAISAPSAKRRTKGRAAGKAPVAQGVFVSAQTVLALANRRLVPRAVFVPASGARPAGLRLIGVAALGIGMRDGDVLTHVQGAPASSIAAVVDAVVRARAGNARVISGMFWRDGRSLPLAVEQPYVTETGPALATAGAPKTDGAEAPKPSP